MATVKCEFCPRMLRTDAVINTDGVGIYQFTCGWVKKRDGGGGHGISLPEPAPRWACDPCIQERIRGSENQRSMF